MVDRTRECNLLVCCSRTRIDSSTRARIGELLHGDIDWKCLLQLAHAHQVLPLAGSTLCESFAAECPSKIVQQLRAALRSSALGGLLAAQKMVEVLDLFTSAGIPVIPYKGPLLAVMAYGRAGLRDFGDLDVWVHPWDDHFLVGRMLADNGWSQVSDFGFERSFKNASNEVVLDVHRTLTHPTLLPFSFEFDEALGRCTAVELAGRSVRTLAPSDLLLVLCVQLAKDTAEERRNPSLIKVCDIAELVRSFPNLDWGAVARQARRLGVLHVVCLCLSVAARLLGTPMPKELEQASRKIADLDSLVCHVEERIFGGEGQQYRRPDLLHAPNWNAAIRERFRDRSEAVIALTQFALAPNDYDYAFVRLPRQISPLYRVLRPVRLVWKYGQRLMGGKSGGGTPS